LDMNATVAMPAPEQHSDRPPAHDRVAGGGSSGSTIRRGLSAILLLLAGVLTMVAYDAVLWRLHAPAVSPVTLLVILLAAACSSIAGFAFSALCGAILFHTIDSPVLVVETLLACSITVQSVSVLALRRAVDWRVLLQLLAGGVIGLPIGVYALLHLGKGAFGVAFGAILIAYGTYRGLRPEVRLHADAAPWNVAVGALGGVTGGLAAFPGAFVTIWCGLQGWDKARQRGVYQPYILMMQLLTIAVLVATPQAAGASVPLDWSVVAYTPAALVGTLLGLWFFRRMSDRQFAGAVNLMLIAAGFGMAF
jgi:uncharacterized protein